MIGRLFTLRRLYCSHRWLGIGFGLLGLLWLLSGLLMLFVERPGLSEAQRLRSLAPLRLEEVELSPASAWHLAGQRAWPEAVRLNVGPDGRPAYRFLSDGRWHSIHADDGSRPRLPSPEIVADVLARLLPSGDASSWQFVGEVERDRWTLDSHFDAYRPFFLYRDAQDREAYLSWRSGEVVFVSTGAQRGGFWLDSSAHFLWLQALGAERAARRAMLFGLALVAAFMAAGGLLIGGRHLRPRRHHPGGRRSPYRAAWKRRYHWLGLVAGLFLLAWLASGWLAYSPFGWLRGSAPSAAERQWLAGGVLDERNLQSRPQAAHSLYDMRGGVREIEWLRFAGHALQRWHGTHGMGTVDERASSRLQPADAGSEQLLDGSGRLSTLAIAERAHGLLAGARLLEVRTIAAPDADYFPGPYRASRFPVVRLRFDDAAGSIYYVDPTSGRLEAKADRRTRLRRWLFGALHRFDLPPLDQRFALRASLVVLAILVAAALSLCSSVLAWRRLRHA